MRLDREDAEEPELNLTPLIDVVFLLLVFFLVSTTFKRDEVEMDLNLPEATSGDSSEDGKLLIINVKRDGAVFVDGRRVSSEALKQKLKAAARRDKDQEVLIRGDEQARYGVIAAVLNACHEVALHAVALGADNAQGR